MYGRREPRRDGQGYREYYVCSRNSTGRGTAATCGNWGITRDRAEKEVLRSLRRLAVTGLPAPAESPGVDELQQRRKQISLALDGVDKRRRNLFRALDEAPDLEEELLARLGELSEEQRRLSTDLAAVDRELRSGGASVSPEEVAALLVWRTSPASSTRPTTTRCGNSSGRSSDGWSSTGGVTRSGASGPIPRSIRRVSLSSSTPSSYTQAVKLWGVIIRSPQ